MKKVFLCMLCVYVMCMVSACISSDEGYDDYFGINKEDFKVIKEEDSHGGFHGDGNYVLILDCSGKKGKALETVSKWNELPLSENLEIKLYGGEDDGITYVNTIAERYNIPRIKNGYYKFYDRHDESKDREDDSELLERYSDNYSLALYDGDTDILYFFEIDT